MSFTAAGGCDLLPNLKYVIQKQNATVNAQ